MTYIKFLPLAAALSISCVALADNAAINESMEEGVYHEKYHETKHAEDQAKHDKGSNEFNKADKNKESKLSKSEAKKLPHIAKHFDEIDVNKDGTVDRDEVHNYMKDHKGQ